MSKEKKQNKQVNEEIKEENISENEEIKETEEKVELTKEEIEAFNNRIVELEKIANEKEQLYLRSQADLINYRKRKDEETSRILKYASSDLVLDLLTVVDNLERALSVETTDENLKNGINMVYTSLINILEKNGVKEIEALGKVFDENYHQAVSTESVSDKEKDIVLEVYQKGYMYKDKLLRPSMVKVNK